MSAVPGALVARFVRNSRDGRPRHIPGRFHVEAASPHSVSSGRCRLTKGFAITAKKRHPRASGRMANSRFEYVKNFELDDTLLPGCWIVIRLDGRGFTK